MTAAIYEAGFNSSGRFYADATQSLGMKPGAYRAGGVDVEIRHATAACSLGLMLVAATDKGVCAIFFGDDAGELERELRDRFPRAKLIGGDRGFGKLVAQVVAYVEAPQKGLAAAARRARHGVPAAGVGGAARDPSRRRRRPTARSPGASASPRPCAPSEPPAGRTRSRSPSHAIASWAATASSTGYRWGVQRKRALLDREKGKALTLRRRGAPALRPAASAPRSAVAPR